MYEYDLRFKSELPRFPRAVIWWKWRMACAKEGRPLVYGWYL